MSDIITLFRTLKLYGMASCYAEMRQQYTPDRMADLESANQILSHSSGQKQLSVTFVPSAIRQLSCHFPDTVIYSILFTSLLKLIHQLATMEFTAAAQNLVLVGCTGTGKTHLAIAIGTSGIQHHNKKVRFFSAIDLG